MIGKLREGGPYAIETHFVLREDDRKFTVAQCAVVYADRDTPSHCVQIFKIDERDNT